MGFQNIETPMSSLTSTFAPHAASGGALPRPRITMHQTMASGHGWIKNSAAGTVADDATTYVIGANSLKLTTDGSASAVVARKTGISAIDLTDRDLIVWVKAADWSVITEFFVYISSDTFTNFNVFAAHTTATLPYAKNGEWVPLTLSFANTTTTGSPNRAAIVSAQVHVKAPSTTTDFWFGGLGSVPKPSAGVVSVTWDDNRDSVYTLGLPVTSRYGIPGTIYTICDAVGTTNYMTLAQLQEIHRIHGWEIATHAGTLAAHNARYTSLTEAELDADLAYARNWMQSNGFIGGADHLAYPGGMYDENVLAWVRKHCVTARTTSTKTQETWPVADPHRLRIFGVYNTTTPATITAAIDKCIAEKTWLILMFHYVTAAGQDDDAAEYPVDDLETVMAYLASSGVAVRNVGDVAKYGF